MQRFPDELKNLFVWSPPSLFSWCKCVYIGEPKTMGGSIVWGNMWDCLVEEPEKKEHLDLLRPLPPTQVVFSDPGVLAKVAEL